MAAFNARLARVAGRAKALEIVEVEREFRMGSHGLDVIDFEASARRTPHAFELITAKRSLAQRFPARRACHPAAMTEMGCFHAGISHANLGRNTNNRASEAAKMGLGGKLIIALVVLAIAAISGLAMILYSVIGFWGMLFLVLFLWILPDLWRAVASGAGASARLLEKLPTATWNWINFAAVFPLQAAAQVFWALFVALVVTSVIANFLE